MHMVLSMAVKKYLEMYDWLREFYIHTNELHEYICDL